MALNTAALMTDSEYLVCIDGDPFVRSSRLALADVAFHKITACRSSHGNPRIRNRTSLAEKNSSWCGFPALSD